MADLKSILPQRPTLSPRRILGRCLEALLPASCLLCGADSGNTLLCRSCLADLPRPPAAACPQCGDRTTHGERCGACLKEPPDFERSVAVFAYDFPVDRIIQALKYGHQLAVAPWLASHLAQLLAGSDGLVVPAPLHPSRLRERGFNQAAEIAWALGRQLRLPVDVNALARIRATLPQAELPPKARRRNVRGVFACNRQLAGRHVILVDDVMTTGATVRECARILKKHGAVSVTIAVAARALKP